MVSQIKRLASGHRLRILWLAALLHRLSGLLLAVFLPFHFLVLGLALEGEARLESQLAWTRVPLVRFAEMGLVFVFAAHLLGGLRILLIENLTWSAGHKRLAVTSVVVATVTAIAFYTRAL